MPINGLMTGQTENNDLWVFAYGSLMWDPDFPHLAARPARLYGYHRALCLYSFDYRGTRNKPGLVLGLDRGGSCRGLAYQIAAKNRDAVIARVTAREASQGEYHLRWLRVRLGPPAENAGPGTRNDPATVTALTFVANRDNPHYAGKRDPGDAARLVRQGQGRRGACVDYLRNTVEHLREMRIRDRGLEGVLRLAIKL